MKRYFVVQGYRIAFWFQKNYRSSETYPIELPIKSQRLRKVLFSLPTNSQDLTLLHALLTQSLIQWKLPSKIFLLHESQKDLFTLPFSHQFILITERDSNFWGLPRKAFIENIRSHRFDALIDFNPTLNLFTAVLAKRSGIPLRIAFYHPDSHMFYNLQIHLRPDDPAGIKYQKFLQYLNGIIKKE